MYGFAKFNSFFLIVKFHSRSGNYKSTLYAHYTLGFIIFFRCLCDVERKAHQTHQWSIIINYILRQVTFSLSPSLPFNFYLGFELGKCQRGRRGFWNGHSTMTTIASYLKFVPRSHQRAIGVPLIRFRLA